MEQNESVAYPALMVSVGEATSLGMSLTTGPAGFFAGMLASISTIIESFRLELLQIKNNARC